jgi:hypothetical protein
LSGFRIDVAQMRAKGRGLLVLSISVLRRVLYGGPPAERQLRLECAPESGQSRSFEGIAMKPMDLAEAVRAEYPRLLEGITEKRAANIVRQVLLAVGREIDKSGQEPLRVPGIGVFRTKIGTKEVGGKPEQTSRIVFRRIPPKTTA